MRAYDLLVSAEGSRLSVVHLPVSQKSKTQARVCIGLLPHRDLDARKEVFGARILTAGQYHGSGAVQEDRELLVCYE